LIKGETLWVAPRETDVSMCKLLYTHKGIGYFFVVGGETDNIHIYYLKELLEGEKCNE
jgi:hypothetical protein